MNNEKNENTLVEFRNVNKSFKNGSLKILDDFSYSFCQGETHVICGRSGVGKSTLIRCINNIESIDSGSIFVEGVELTPKTVLDIRKKVAMVFQDFNLFPHMSVLENVTFGPIHSLKIGKKEAEESGLEYLEQVGLKDRADSKPYELSGGQKQRVAIARALNMHPELILFDEPTSALDPEMVGGVLQIMADLSQKGMSMIVVTHEMSFAREAADKISFLEGGKFLETADPDTFFDHPKHPSVQKFIQQVYNK